MTIFESEEKLSEELARVISAGESVRIGIKIDKLIYVKRMSPYGFWLDEEECDPKESIEDLIDELEKGLRVFDELEEGIDGGTSKPESQAVKLPELVKEVIHYHAEYKPLKRADYVFHRIDA